MSLIDTDSLVRLANSAPGVAAKVKRGAAHQLKYLADTAQPKRPAAAHHVVEEEEDRAPEGSCAREGGVRPADAGPVPQE